MSTSQVALQEHAASYLSHWRALGRRYRQEEWLLKVLQRELPALGHSDLTAEAFSAWQDARKDRHPNSRRKWAQLVRHFCLFRQRSEPDCFVPGPELACRRQPYVTPVIMSDAHVAQCSVSNTVAKPAMSRIAVQPEVQERGNSEFRKVHWNRKAVHSGEQTAAVPLVSSRADRLSPMRNP